MSDPVDPNAEESKSKQSQLLSRVNRSLLPNKLFYFSNSAGYGSFQPYLTLFFKQLWLPASVAGILFGIMHLWRFATGWLLSAIGDKYQKRKLFLFFGMFVSGVAFLMTAFAPPYQHKCTDSNLNTTRSNDDFLTGNSTGDFNERINSYHHVTYIYLLIFISVSGFFSSANDPLSDTLTLQALDGNPDGIGFQRCFGGLGYGLAAFFSGAIIALQPKFHTCEAGTSIDYKPTIYIGSIIWIIGSFTVFFLTDKGNIGNNSCLKFWANVKTSLTLKITMVVFIGMYCGAVKSTIDSFLFWRLEEIGGTQTLNTLIKGLHSISEFVGFVFSETLINRLTHFGVMYLALTCYALQLLIYVLIHNPWLCFLSEWMPGITFAAFLSSGISYIGLCPGVASTMQAMFTTVFLGLGFGIGPIISGPLVGQYGTVRVFTGCCILTVVVLIIFVVTTKLEVKRDREDGYKQIIEME